MTITPLELLRAPHLGRLWDRLSSRYPRVEEAPPIIQSEDLPANPATGLPLPRVWFISEDDTKLVQFQVNKLFVNWRAREGNPSYPRFPEILSDFEWAIRSLDGWAQDLGIGPVEVKGCELTYINHFGVPSGVRMVDVATSMLRDFVWADKTTRYLPVPQDLAWRHRFSMPGDVGTLTVKVNPATRKTDGGQVIMLELAARSSGSVNFEKRETVSEWMQSAREMIVRGFCDLTNETVQKEEWGREA